MEVAVAKEGGGRCRCVSGMARWPSLSGVAPRQPPALPARWQLCGECILHGHSRGVKVGDGVCKCV